MRTRRAALLFLALGAGLAGLGLALGQPEGVLTKAATICLECVGIG